MRQSVALVTMRVVGAVVLLGVLITSEVVVSTRVAADECSIPGRVVPHGAWTSIRTPEFPDSTDDREVSAYAVDPGGSSHLLMTNGTSVMYSKDSGCVWTNVFSVPTERATTPDSVVKSGRLSVEFMAFGAGGHGYLVMAGDQSAGDSLAAESSYDGSSWTASRGLPLQGNVRALAPSRATESVAYLLIDHDLYATDDAGSTWTLAAQLDFEVFHLRVDDIDPNDLWGWTRSTLYHLRRDGSVISAFSPPSGGVASVDVSHAPDLPARVLVFGENGSLLQSIDGGKTYGSAPASFESFATSAAHAKEAPDRPLVTTRDGVMWRAADQAWSNVTPDSAVTFDDVQVGGVLGFVRTEDGLERRNLLDRDAVDVDAPQVDTRIPSAFLAPPGPASLTPAGGTVRVVAGQNVSVAYTAFVPHRFKPVDFYFLADTTDSTDSIIVPLQHSIGKIIQGLRLAGIDARVGLGTFRDYPVRPYGQRGDYPYRRERDVGPLDDALTKAVNSLQSGGGGDYAESQLPALYQTATGDGQGAPGAPIYVAPRQQASFRAGVTRVVMLATDAPFHRSDTDPTYPGPSLVATVDALRQRSIKVVGLSMDAPAVAGLRELARATGALASNDVDCDGDGRSDVRAGGSIVCSVAADGQDVTAPVLNAIAAAQDGETVTAAVSAPGNVVRRFTPASFGVVGLGLDHSLPIAVTYGCDTAQVGGSFPVSIVVSMAGALLTRTSARVECVAATPVKPSALRAAALPGKPLPNVHQASTPPPAPVSSANMAPQANVQPGMGNQERHQAQAMLATTDGPTSSGDVELAFSALAAAAMGAAAVILTRRGRPAPSVRRTR